MNPQSEHLYQETQTLERQLRERDEEIARLREGLSRAAVWKIVADELPPPTIPFPLWGTNLSEEHGDFPIMGALCGCHNPGVFVLETCTEDDEGAYTKRMLGTVTHWLDWRPGPTKED